MIKARKVSTMIFLFFYFFIYKCIKQRNYNQEKYRADQPNKEPRNNFNSADKQKIKENASNE
jgi:hypothetical protein